MTTEVHADSNNNTGIVLVPNIKQEDGVDEECQERCRVAGLQFAAERGEVVSTTSVTTRATARATAFGHEYDRPIMPKGVDRVYRIVNTLTGSLGGAGCGGAIYGELTKSSMHKLIKLMVDSIKLGPDSRFLDVGSGVGKPNLHVAQYPGVKVSIGIELIYERWLLSISCLKACLKTAATDAAAAADDATSGRYGPADPASSGRLKGNTMFILGDITKACTFDPFTHVYMFSVGFPPALWKRLATIWNNSNPNTCLYFICYSPEKDLEEYDFDVELVAETGTTMHGSKEHHKVYLYKRSKPPADWCDPLFQSSYDLVKRGLKPLKSFVDEQERRETCKRSRRSAGIDDDDSSVDEEDSAIMDDDDEEANLWAQTKRKRRRTASRVSRRLQGIVPEFEARQSRRKPRKLGDIMNGTSFLSIRYNSRKYRGPGIGGPISVKKIHDRRTDSRKFLDGIWQERRRLQFHTSTSSLSSRGLKKRINLLVSMICAACAETTDTAAMKKDDDFLSTNLGCAFKGRVKETCDAVTNEIASKLDIELGISGADIMRMCAPLDRQPAFATATGPADPGPPGPGLADSSGLPDPSGRSGLADPPPLPVDPNGGRGGVMDPRLITEKALSYLSLVNNKEAFRKLGSLMDRRLSQADYAEMKRTLEEAVPITNVKGKSPFLSRHLLKKSCNNEQVRAIKIPTRENEEVAADDDVDESEYYNTNMKPGQLREVKEEIMKMEGIKNAREIQVRTVLGAIRKAKGFELIGARTPGSFSKDIKKIVAKLQRHNHKFGKTSVCVTCGDGAGMNENLLHPINITSYSSAIMSACMMNGTSLADTKFMLTWQQVIGPEDLAHVLPVLEDWLKGVAVATDNAESFVLDSTMEFLNMNDMSMLYKILGCVSWSCNLQFHPLCKCNKGEALEDKGVDANNKPIEHVCEVITDKEQQVCYEKSRDYAARVEKLHPTQSDIWKKDKVKTWSMKNNYGITHYGVEPHLFPLSKTVPDGLHQRCSVAKTLMANLRTCIGKEDQETIDLFESHLLKSPGNPDGFFKLSHLVVWSLNKKFDCFTGAELGLFSENAAALADWMEKSDNISSDESLEFTSLCTALRCWTRINAFLTIAVVQPSDNVTVNSSVLYDGAYFNSMRYFEEDVKTFYEAGKHSFLQGRGGTIEYGGETVYLHTLRFHTPRLMRKIWKKHGLPIGCFTMQGFERRNQESKRIYRTHYNKRMHKCCLQILQRLLEAFHCC